MKEKPISQVILTSRFKRMFQKLPFLVKDAAKDKEIIFRQNAFDARPDTHKLHGRLKGLWSFEITYEYRILFEFVEHDKVIFYAIGTHDDVY